jgi:hypothetical protein
MIQNAGEQPFTSASPPAGFFLERPAPPVTDFTAYAIIQGETAITSVEPYLPCPPPVWEAPEGFLPRRLWQ